MSTLSPSATGNGTGAPQPTLPGAVPRPAPSAAARQGTATSAFANIVAVLMRDPGFRNLRLADLEWLVIPPLVAGQWRIAEGIVDAPGTAPRAGVSTASVRLPVAVMLWAMVTPAVDQRLMQDLDKPLQLRPEEWSGGDHPWLIAAAGNRQSIASLLDQLAADDFKGKPVKFRGNGPDGSVTIQTLPAGVLGAGAEKK